VAAHVFPLARVRGPFHALVVSVVPEARRLDAAGWRELEQVVGGALESRPQLVTWQLRLFMRVLQWLPLLRFGRPLTRLDASRRTRFLEAMQNSPVALFRKGFWGVRTVALLGYYGRAAAGSEIGYCADPRGWEARR
jgi:hypothetical protein